MKRFFLQFLMPALALFFTANLSSCKKDKTDPVDPEPEYRKEILLSPFAGQAADKGQLLVLTPAGDTIWKKDIGVRAYNFRRWVVNRSIRYSYTEAKPTTLDGNFAGVVVIMDKDFNEISRISLKPYGERTTDSVLVDGHDFIMIDDNHYMVMSYYAKKVTNIPTTLSPNPNCKVVLCLVQEVKNGEVVWEWNSGEHPELYTTSVEGNKFTDDTKPQDYLHMNSMCIDPKDNNLICSFRNSDQIVKINHQNGKIMWALGLNGDFQMSSNQLFMKQHNVTLTDNNETLLVFDNGDASKRNYSRILEFKLDETAKKITSFKSFTIPGSGFSQYMGSVQKTSSTYFIGGGSIPKMWEVNLQTGSVTWEHVLSGSSYTAFKY